MDNDFVTWLGPTAMATIAVALINVFLKIRDNRTARRLGLDQGFLSRYSNDVKWINAYRHQAERHGWWDQDVRMANLQKDVAINRLEERLGIPITKFEPIPPPPPLFPIIDENGEPVAHD